MSSLPHSFTSLWRLQHPTDTSLISLWTLLVSHSIHSCSFAASRGGLLTCSCREMIWKKACSSSSIDDDMMTHLARYHSRTVIRIPICVSTRQKYSCSAQLTRGKLLLCLEISTFKRTQLLCLTCPDPLIFHIASTSIYLEGAFSLSLSFLWVRQQDDDRKVVEQSVMMQNGAT